MSRYAMCDVYCAIGASYCETVVHKCVMLTPVNTVKSVLDHKV